ncbi:uncharacterized protein [Rhodnius prolixus]|uniref:uncharacterized protein n=1 Tax=Rhodnius prolixus TaxID=13249 RepID=UPI003D18A735
MPATNRLTDGITRPSYSDYSSHTFLVQKRNGEKRLLIALYQLTNRITAYFFRQALLPTIKKSIEPNFGDRQNDVLVPSPSAFAPGLPFVDLHDRLSSHPAQVIVSSTSL